MKSIRYVFLAIILSIFCVPDLKAQTVAPEDKVEIFSSKEKDNLQIWFHEEVKKMKLSEEEMNQYTSIITYYIAKIARLDDKDKDYSKDRLKQELNTLLSKQDVELKELLSPEQYAVHKDIYAEFLRSAYKRWGISNP